MKKRKNKKQDNNIQSSSMQGRQLIREEERIDDVRLDAAEITTDSLETAADSAEGVADSIEAIADSTESAVNSMETTDSTESTADFVETMSAPIKNVSEEYKSPENKVDEYEKKEYDSAATETNDSKRKRSGAKASKARVDDLIIEQDSTLFDESPKETEMSRLELTGDFADFVRDFFGRVYRWMKANHHMLGISLGVCAAAVVVIWIAGALSRRTDAARIEDSVSSGVIIDLTGNNDAIPVPQEALRENEYPAVNDLVARYFLAMQNNDIAALSTLKNYVDAVETAKVNVKYRYVESYNNINCYTKVGPFPDSYIVYVCYDVKMRDWDITAPSLLTLFVCTNSNGNLYIYTGDFDENVANYIAAISSQADVIDLLTRVDTEYHEIMDANADFDSYMSALNQVIKDEVGEQLAASGYLEDDTEQVSGEGIEQGGGTDPTGENSQVSDGSESFEVQAITTVNVRASDSEVADRLGRVTAGTILPCNGHQVNGWSEVVFENQIGYIKTEYLFTLGEEADPSQANGTVMVSETVNVRATADVNGEKLGVAYEGESFPLIGDTNGEWTHIIYNGQNAFIKTEFLNLD